MSKAPTIDADDARSWGRQAFEMGLSLKDALRDISYCGCPKRYLPLVEETYEQARSQARHREG
jgi:hypothetical protein